MSDLWNSGFKTRKIVYEKVCQEKSANYFSQTHEEIYSGEQKIRQAACSMPPKSLNGSENI
ncbi:MAG: hypothetical protein A3F82_00850 [Deltaproteobacteria bacterium RIFCSPLOWO2_12_FULL_44_12]|nr:MAG: hypothetical protein A2712_04105 [Deltaproteobacteria bacterium RIFCSPHIGHO2_01_FULL_43_49]OGQ16368.1 MAG: hypothetical protein A3D22_02075 [Deltaproteobacteria bacterium RIFCSPHIGHO2_02_FULL_44_53]OGQ27806.1 MAG: hypothetical protein A3D98_08915 [Deltaproteobacteria bacterium RIFCSPHIGHO2_12_FULL_44_21]OGQ32886.1 MAG: hypothetical protein A2979_10005 [Deltaproteobacteria bacterium RIFCSPLOWO2_01_FULL_45_74]OGQ41987.1 MAG: hypothetical protein A3I70_09790 [Deltaproteobacteria bacterium 